MAESAVPVLVLDDDPGVTTSVERLLSLHGFDVHGFHEPDACLEAVPGQDPSCLLLDMNLGDKNGFDVLSTIREESRPCAVVFLSAYGDVPSAVRAMNEGAVNFLVKPFDPDEVVKAVQKASEQAFKNWRNSRASEGLRKRAAGLTRRERQVTALMAHGLVNKEIADRLNLAEATVKVHRMRAMKRLGARTSAELAHLAAGLDLSAED